MNGKTKAEEGSRRRRAAGVVVGFLLLGALVASFPPAAANHGGYYNNSSSVVQQDTPKNATLDNILGLAVDLAPSVIGTGEQERSGTGFEGILLTGIAFGGVSLAVMAGTGLGAVGGTILGLITSYGLVDLGYAPEWIKVILLFGLGTLIFLGARRVLD